MKARATRGAFESYVVERGDTLASVARKTKTRAEVILLLNPHASASALSRGMVLDVPARGERGNGKIANGSTETRGPTAAVGGRGASVGGAKRGGEGKTRGGDGGAAGRRRDGGERETKTTFSGQMYDRSYPAWRRGARSCGRASGRRWRRWGRPRRWVNSSVSLGNG